MKTIKYIFLTLLLIVLGFFVSEGFYNYSFSLLQKSNVIIIRTLTEESYLLYLFPIIVGTMPLFYLLIRKTTEIKFLYKGLIACLIIICFGILFWRLRIYGLNAEFIELSAYSFPNQIKPSIKTSYLKFEVYVFMGFIVGTLVSILLFRNKNKSLLN